MTKENRKSLRRTVQHNAAILNSDGSILGGCAMMDVSAQGAKLVVQGEIEIPDEFVLLLTRGGKVRRQCKVAWRKEDEIGVKFLGGPPKDGTKR
jgi:PilZ domain